MRIATLSDQHGFLPEIPPCDLLIVAGDICPDRFGHVVARAEPEHQARWFDRKIRPWLADSPARHKVVTWGNHDWCGQACDFSHDSPAKASSTRLQVLVDESTSVPTGAVDGVPQPSTVTIWGTPWSPRFMDWAFMKDPEDLVSRYAAIPAGTDVLVSHCPPHGYGDWSDERRRRVEHLGSRELLVAIDRVRPRLVICGHIHGGHGRYEHDGIPIYNVSVADEQYRLTHEPTVIDLV
jgi:Icc-related predicted phosphoesterase